MSALTDADFAFYHQTSFFSRKRFSDYLPYPHVFLLTLVNVVGRLRGADAPLLIFPLPLAKVKGIPGIGLPDKTLGVGFQAISFY